MPKASYLPISIISERYSLPKSTVYDLVAKVEKCDRYKRAWVELNSGRRKLINVLVLEDYMYYRDRLEDKNMSKTVPPYDPREVMWQRGGKNNG